MKKKVLVRAPVLTRSGYGEHSRFVLRALRKHEDEYDIYVLPVNWGKCGWIYDDDEERQWLDDLILKTANYQQQKKEDQQYDISIQVTIPNEWENFAPVNIGVTAGIETTKVAPVWLERANMMDKVVTVSEHSKDVFLRTEYEGVNKETNETINLKCSTPIEVVHYPVKKFEDTNLNFKLKTDFNFLTVAQWGPRKNIENTIKWFVEEFIDQPVGLVVKTFGHGNSVVDRYNAEERLANLLKEYENRKCKIYLLHGDLTDQEMHSLYKHPKIKAFISLSHGEGFGLPHFEAAYSGLPVVAPEWSGYVDFLSMTKTDKKGKDKVKPCFARVDYELKPVQKKAVWDGVLVADSMWCFAKQGSYKMKLREVYKDYGRFKSQAEDLQKWVVKEFEESNQYEKLIKSMRPPSYIEPTEFDGVSFCVATNGSKIEKTRVVLEALKNQLTTKEIEIIVVGDTKPFKDIENIKLVEASDVANSGHLAELRNIGARNSTKEVVCYLDDDMILPPQWLWRLEEYSKTEGWDILGNRILNPDGSRMWDRAVMNPHVLVPYTHPETDKNIYQTGGFWITRKTVFEEHPWDGSIPLYAEKEGKPNEDIEYSRRLHENGFIFKFDAQNLIWHWDSAYTQVQLPDGNFQTLRKSVVEEHMGPQPFPPPCQEFKNLMSAMGQNLE